MRFQKFISLLCALTLVLGGYAYADESGVAQLNSTIDNLQKQIGQMRSMMDQMNQQIRDIEKREPQVIVSKSGAAVQPMTQKDFDKQLEASIGPASQWLKDLKFGGDMRLRYEGSHFNSGNPSETDDYNRFRIRLRYGFEKTFNPDMKVGFYMASGGTTDPTSTNTSFDGNFVNKSLQWDRAYATYTPSWAKEIGPIKKLEITGGKFKNPFEKGSSKIIWDTDVRPEGVYEKVDLDLIKTDGLEVGGYLTYGQFVLDEASGSSKQDAELFALQFGLNPKFDIGLERPVEWLSAFSWYNFNGYADNSDFGSFARGNFNRDGDSTTLDAGDFNIIEIYNELLINPYAPRLMPNLPVKVYYDVATNTATDLYDLAWALGMKLGSAKKKGQWQLGYEYRYIEPNAVVGAFADSDFGLTGHTDARGSVISGAYKLTDDLSLESTLFLTGHLSSDAITRDEEKRMLQVDMVWKF